MIRERQITLGDLVRPILCAIIVVMTVSSSGCVRRRLWVRSNPEGALVFVDDQQIGLTPTSTEFTYYGTRKIRVEKDGYETAIVSRTFFPPWYELPVADFIVENLWPWEVHDDREVDLRLAPLKLVPRNELAGRAEALRTSAQQQLITPLPRVGSRLPGASFFQRSPSSSPRY